MYRLIAVAALAVSALCGLVAVGTAQSAPQPRWSEILNPAKPTLPKPRNGVEWLTTLDEGLKQARDEGRPLFVTMRCLPCKQCSQFDTDVLDGGDTLGPLLRQFVCVRVTTMRDTDSRILPFADYQDLDLSWWGYFLSDKAQLYGVYGGRDEVSDTTRISEKGLIDALTKVLAHHYDKRRASWNIDLPAPDLAGAKSTPKQLEGWKSWTKHGAREVADHECLHCHQVAEILRQPAFDAKKFDKQKDFHEWPLPENIGLTVDRDSGLTVAKLAKNSPADKAGIRPGDEIGAANGKRLFTQADLRGVLHRLGRNEAKLELVWLRKGEVKSAVLELTGEWWRAGLNWRKSVAEARIGANMGFNWPVGVNAKERTSRGIAKDKLAVKPYYPKTPQGPAADAGLTADDIITAVNGESPNIEGRAFVVWFRLNFEPGDEIKLTVVARGGKEREIKYKAPAPKDD